jgi:hypothetical protein
VVFSILSTEKIFFRPGWNCDLIRKTKIARKQLKVKIKNLPEGFSETGIIQSLPGVWILYCSTIEFDFADKISAGDQKRL